MAAIANLLPRNPGESDFLPLDEGRLGLLKQRLLRVQSVLETGGIDRPAVTRLLEEFEDWGEEVSPQNLAALLIEIDELRIVHDRPLFSPIEGRWVAYLWGRSEGTGEAEVASRGFFDAWDRPPPVFWLEVLARPAPRGAMGHEIALLSYVPISDCRRAEAGRLAAPSGSLMRLADLSPTLEAQLGPWLSDYSVSESSC